MKSLLLLFVLGLFSLNVVAQDTIEAKELSKKELKKLQKELRKKEEASQYNEYHVDVNAPSLARAIRWYLGNHRLVNGNIILRGNQSMNTTDSFVTWDVDNMVRRFPPNDVNLPSIRYVKVLRSLSETNKYGFLGANGVIVIKTTNTYKEN
jgi:hypothetical protein